MYEIISKCWKMWEYAVLQKIYYLNIYMHLLCIDASGL